MSLRKSPVRAARIAAALFLLSGAVGRAHASPRPGPGGPHHVGGETSQDARATPGPAGQAGERDDLYRKFLEERQKQNGEAHKRAYEYAKEYLSKYGMGRDEEDAKVISYLQAWVTRYEKSLQKFMVARLLEGNRYLEAFFAGKQVLAAEPEDVATLTNTALAGISASYNNPAVGPEAVAFAQKAVELIKAGRAPDPSAPLQSRDKALGLLYLSLGYYRLPTDQVEAARYLYQSTLPEGPVKRSSQTYALLAGAYQVGYLDPLSQEFKDKCASGPTSAMPECQALSASIDEVLARIIDAYARAVNYAGSGTDGKTKENWRQNLTYFFKLRHKGSESGLASLMSALNEKPPPPPPPPPPMPPTPVCPGCSSPDNKELRIPAPKLPPGDRNPKLPRPPVIRP